MTLTTYSEYEMAQKLDEKLKFFRTEALSHDVGLLVFQFDTGGFSIEFKREMTMTHVVDQLHAGASRLERYQNEGFPRVIGDRK